MYLGPDVETRQGLLVLIDALGTKAAAEVVGWPSVTRDWAKIVLSAKQQKRLTIATDLPGGPPKAELEFIEVEPQAFGFSDTFLMTFKAARADHELLKAATYWMRSEFNASIEEKRPLRGAVSVGTYCVDAAGTIAMGPAVADAAAWYEAADWAGMVLTPQTAEMWLKKGARYSLLSSGEKNPTASATLWHEFRVPMSRSRSHLPRRLSMYGLAWPGVDPPARDRVVEAFGDAPPCSAARRKRNNTLRFYDEVRSQASALPSASSSDPG